MKLLHIAVQLLLINGINLVIALPRQPHEYAVSGEVQPRDSSGHEAIMDASREPTAATAPTTEISPVKENGSLAARRPPMPFIYPVYDASSAIEAESYIITPTAAVTMEACVMVQPRRPPMPYGPDEYDPNSEVPCEITLTGYGSNTMGLTGNSLQGRRPPMGNIIPVYQPDSDEFPAEREPAPQHHPAPSRSQPTSLRGQAPSWSNVPAEAQSNWAARTLSVEDAVTPASVTPDTEADDAAAITPDEDGVTSTEFSTLQGTTMTLTINSNVPESSSPVSPVFMTVTQIVTLATLPSIPAAISTSEAVTESIGYGNPEVSSDDRMMLSDASVPSISPEYDRASSASSVILTIDAGIVNALLSIFQAEITTASEASSFVEDHEPTSVEFSGLVGHETSAWQGSQTDDMAAATTIHIAARATDTPPAYLFRGPPNMTTGGANKTGVLVMVGVRPPV